MVGGGVSDPGIILPALTFCNAALHRKLKEQPECSSDLREPWSPYSIFSAWCFGGVGMAVL